MSAAVMPIRKIVSACAISGSIIPATATSTTSSGAIRRFPDLLLNIPTSPPQFSRWLFLVQSYATAVPLTAIASLILITVSGSLRLPNQQKMAYFVNSA
jgi:hypothetical protein